MRRHGLIIAGGHGSRLGGVRKADIRIGGVALLDRVVAALESCDGEMMLSTGVNGTIQTRGLTPVPDIDAPIGGPLAGLIAGIDHLNRLGITDGLLVSASVDTPFLPRDFADALIGAMKDGRSALACWGDDFYPPNAVWRIKSLTDLPHRARLGDAPKSLKALHAELGAVQVDWRGRSGENPFHNLNTLSDLVMLGKRARG